MMTTTPDDLVARMRADSERASNGDGDAAVRVAADFTRLDEELRAGAPLPRVWTHEEEIIDRLPDGSPKTTITRGLRLPAGLADGIGRH